MSDGIQALGPTQALAPNNTSVNADFASGAPSVLVTNTGTAVCFVRVQPQAGAVAASVTDVPLLGGTAAVFDAVPGTLVSRVSIFSAASLTAYVTPVQGAL